MKIKLLKDCLANVPRETRLIGLDLGSKTIGLAVSDSGHAMAMPLTTIERRKFIEDITALLTHVREYEVGGFIIGFPLNMDGSVGPRCDATRSFVDEMVKHPEFTKHFGGKSPFIAFQDERLSTHSVDDFLDNRVDMKKKSKRGAKEKGLVDKLAAQIILQGALDMIKA